jgi:hypothetical protein
VSRYDGKPFLRLLDCYVLHAIGHLGSGQLESLRQMEPKLTQVYGQTGSWTEIVAAQMNFPPTLPDRIKDIWEAGKARAEQQGLMVEADEFARQFVDTNFPHSSP